MRAGKITKLGQGQAGGMKMRKVTVMRQRVVRGGYQGANGYRQGAYSIQEGGNGFNQTPPADQSQRM